MVSALAIARARKHGIKVPIIAWQVSRKVGLEYAVLCAVLEQETAGGKNVYGHDRDRHGRIIWHGRREEIPVTKKNYANYKAFRRKTGLCQGVGPMQLTYSGFQDLADELGGCWNKRANITVGAMILRNAIRRKGLRGALKEFNGSEAYADQVMAKVKKWRRILHA